MAYGEKIQYISAIEVILKEQEKKKRDLYLDELVEIPAFFKNAQMAAKCV